jgi:methylated-DNA-protein-cysteine methyltransferase-like protein
VKSKRAEAGAKTEVNARTGTGANAKTKTGAGAKAKTSMFADMLRQVRKVPRGKVATYGDIAYAAGYPGAARQVAWALHAESAGLPWHRIVGAGGSILLPGEQGFEQRMNLQTEGIGFLGLKVNMLAHQHSFFAKDDKATKAAGKTAKKKSAGKQAKSSQLKRARTRRA